MGRLKVNKLTGQKLLQYLERKRTLRHNTNLIINNLPHEIYLLIFKYCSDYDIYLSFSRVCKKWREVLKSSRSLSFMRDKFLHSWERKCFCESQIENFVPSTFSEYVSILFTYLTSKHNLLITPKNSIFDSKTHCAKCSEKNDWFHRYGISRSKLRIFRTEILCSEICMYSDYKLKEASFSDSVNIESIKSITKADYFLAKAKDFLKSDEKIHIEFCSRMYKKFELKLLSQQKELCKMKKLAERKMQRSPNWKKQKIRRPKFRKNGGRFKKNYR